MIVMKFGGTSVESAAAIDRVAGIVRERLPRKPVVVVSAMGKTTNKLLDIAQQAVNGHREQALRQLYDLRDFHLRESNMERTVEEHFQELSDLTRGLAILGELSPRSIDAFSSFGERLSSLIVANYFQHHGIPAVHLDSRKVVVTDSRHTQAAPQYAETYARLAATVPPLADKQVVVMGGFIGATLNGVTTTLGRGGSDFTAAIVGAGIGAEEIQIWTDVDGMLTCDPTVCSGGHRVDAISFAEAAELAYFGAKVLHPATVLPAVEKNIPVRILNSQRPHVEGTRIVSESVPSANIVKSIANKKNVTVLNIRSTRMFMVHGFLRRIFDVFDRYETSVDMVSTSEISVSLTIDQTAHLEQIVRELHEFAEVSVDQNQAIICLVGEKIPVTAGIGARVFKALDDINVRMVSQGASSMNLGFIVQSADLPKAVQRLHNEFFVAQGHALSPDRP
jgi:aspartate kinase